MAFPKMLKDPSSVLDFEWDWSAWLTTGETIAMTEWVLEPGIVNDHTSVTPTTATIWLSGGTDGTSYVVTCRVTSSAGRIDDRSLTIKVVQR